MRSNGGLATPQMIAELPVLTLLSGPAAGVLGGAWSGALSGRRKLITFDIGGTSADIGVVTDGRFSEASARDTWIGGYPVIVPMIDIHTIGAGGGSIAYVDSGGTFKVGPESAGSQPGPAAYGRGGDATDRDRCQSGARTARRRTTFSAASMALDAGAAGTVIGELAKQLGLDAPEAAEGALTSSTTIWRMRSARGRCRRASIRANMRWSRSAAPARCTARMSRRCSAFPEVIVPPYPGITSAMGLLTTDIKYEVAAHRLSGQHRRGLRAAQS